jgi:hypothetical protein
LAQAGSPDRCVGASRRAGQPAGRGPGPGIISDSFRRERTARAQTWIEGNRAAIERLQGEARADPDLDPLTAARALSLMLSRSAYVTFVLEEEGAESIEGLAETLTRLWVNALRIPLAPAPDATQVRA